MGKRKKYIVDKDFQLKIIIVSFFLIAGIFMISIFWSYATSIQIEHIEKQSGNRIFGAELNGHDYVMVRERIVVDSKIIKYWLAGGILITILIAVFILFYSHRIVGPIYHLQKHLEKMIEGDYSKKLFFRKHDEFKYLADTINKLQDTLVEKNK